MTSLTPNLLEIIQNVDSLPVTGRVSQVTGLVVEGYSDISEVGQTCVIVTKSGREIPAEVVGFKDDRVLFMPFGYVRGIGQGNSIHKGEARSVCHVGNELLGRVINGMGQPLDRRPPPRTTTTYPLYPSERNPMERQRIRKPLDLGIRAINGLHTCAQGQRMGIFSGTGVGKSVLLGMIARYTEADVNVIALIGERGREVLEFIEKDLGTEGLKRSVVVVATSDQAPVVRRRAACLAMSIAEYFRDQNQHVLFMMDSLTRLAHAQREIGLSIGEPPTTKSYTPSVFSFLPQILERAGTSKGGGTITGLYAVLLEGDDIHDPMPDAARALLDGHIVLSRELAMKNQYPAIDVLNSISRVMVDVVDSKQLEYARKFTELVATYRAAEDMIHIGAYKRGSSPKIDKAVDKWDEVQAYLRQEINRRVGIQESVNMLIRLFRD